MPSTKKMGCLLFLTKVHKLMCIKKSPSLFPRDDDLLDAKEKILFLRVFPYQTNSGGNKKVKAMPNPRISKERSEKVNGMREARKKPFFLFSSKFVSKVLWQLAKEIPAMMSNPRWMKNQPHDSFSPACFCAKRA